MKQMLRTTVFLTAILIGASYANAKAAKLNIVKSSTASTEIKAIANSAEEENSEVAKSMQHIFSEAHSTDTKEVLEYVETEMGHQEAATASHKPEAEAKTN